MSTQVEAEKQGKSRISGEEKEKTSQHKLDYNRTRGKNEKVVANLPQKPVPKRRHIPPQTTYSYLSEDGHMEGQGRSQSEFTSSSRSQEDHHSNQFGYQKPVLEWGRLCDTPLDGDEVRHSVLGAVTRDDSVQGQQKKPLPKEKYVDTSIWHKLLHPEQRNVKRCRPSENRFDDDDAEGNTPSDNQHNRLQDSENRKLLAMEEGMFPLRIIEDPPLPADVQDAELRVKNRMDSVGTNYLKEIGRQLEIIEQGELANLHLDPADEDPMFAAVIPRPDVYAVDGSNSGDAAFHRGEPVRSSAGGVIGATSNSRPRPRTHSDNAGPMSPDVNIITPSRRGFARTPVRRHSKSPSSSPVARRAPFSDFLRDGNKNNVSYEVCILLTSPNFN